MHDSLHIVSRIFMQFHAVSCIFLIESLAPGVGKAWKTCYWTVFDYFQGPKAVQIILDNLVQQNLNQVELSIVDLRKEKGSWFT